MEDLSELERQRRAKLERLVAQGIDPYPPRTQRTHSTTAARALLEASANPDAKPEVSVAGRLVAVRVMGKAAFAHVQDGDGRLQLYLRQDELGAETYNFFRHDLDLGDFVEAGGWLMRTKTGELTLHVTALRLLAKSLRPLPEKWHGLKDQELRYRQRYLDLLSKNHELSPERRGFLNQGALFIAGLFLVPHLRHPNAPNPNAPNQTTKRRRHPFEGINIKASHELKGAEKANAIQQVLNQKDTKNVLPTAPKILGADQVTAALHELDGGNTLTAIAFPADRGVVFHYQFKQPTNGFKTWSGIYAPVNDKLATLISTSVNGQSVALKREVKAITTAYNPMCPDCLQGFVQNCWLCTSLNLSCFGQCCPGICG